MDAVLGTYRNGRVEFRTAPPVEWTEGDYVVIERHLRKPEIDIRDDGPEAAQAWNDWYARLDRQIGATTFPEELQAMLDADKRDELSQWESQSQRIESVLS